MKTVNYKGDSNASITDLCTWQLLFLFFFACEVGSHWDPRTQAYCPIALYPSFRFIGGCLGVQPPYQCPRSRSASPLLFVPDPSWQNPRSASLPFPTLGIHIECAPMFPFLHCISSLCSPHLVLHVLQTDMQDYEPYQHSAMFRVSLLMNWTYLSVSPSGHNWLV